MDCLALLSMEARTIRGPRPTVRDICTGADPPLHISGWSTPKSRTVRDDAEGRLLCSRPISRLPEGTPSGRRDPRVCLGVGRPSKTSLVDVESKRVEDSM
jgi:hypothetical protein